LVARLDGQIIGTYPVRFCTWRSRGSRNEVMALLGAAMGESPAAAEVGTNHESKLNSATLTSTTNSVEIASPLTDYDVVDSIPSTLDTSAETSSSIDGGEAVALVALEPPELIKDPLAILFFALGPAIWLVMAIQSFKFAALAIVCHAQMGFFLLLVSLGYRRRRAAKATLAGIAFCGLLSSISWFY
jgi:hypothetical protein